MARAALALTRTLAACAAFSLLGAVQLPPSAPGCIAAITAVPTGTALSGQIVTFTDGTIVNPETRFIVRVWNFGDGTQAKSSNANSVTASHAFENRTGSTRGFSVRLTEQTGLGTCTTTLSVDVSPSNL